MKGDVKDDGPKKSFWARLVEKLDKKMKEKAQSCCCSAKDKESGGSSCCG
jgi:hypothetical protein